MRLYELTVIINPSLDDSSIQAEIDKIEKQITDSNGKIHKIDRWGVRRLAYIIQGSNQGYYVLFLFEADSGLTSGIEKSLRINENIFRFLTVMSVSEVPVEKAEPEVEGGHHDEPAPIQE